MVYLSVLLSVRENVLNVFIFLTLFGFCNTPKQYFTSRKLLHMMRVTGSKYWRTTMLQNETKIFYLLQSGTEFKTLGWTNLYCLRFDDVIMFIQP